MKTIYKYKILMYILSIFGMLAALFLFIFGFITYGTSILRESIEEGLEDYYLKPVEIRAFYANEDNADLYLYFEYTTDGTTYYGSLNYETLEIIPDDLIGVNSIELPRFLYFTDGVSLMVISPVVGLISLILIITTIVAHVKGNAQQSHKMINTNVTSIEDKMTEAKTLLDKGLITQEEYETRKDKILNDI